MARIAFWSLLGLVALMAAGVVGSAVWAQVEPPAVLPPVPGTPVYWATAESIGYTVDGVSTEFTPRETSMAAWNADPGAFLGAVLRAVDICQAEYTAGRAMPDIRVQIENMGADAVRVNAYSMVQRRLESLGSTAANDTSVWQALADLRNVP